MYEYCNWVYQQIVTLMIHSKDKIYLNNNGGIVCPPANWLGRDIIRGVVKLSGSLHVTLKGPYEDEVRIRCSTFKIDLQLILENTFFQSLRKMNKMYNQTRMHSSMMRTIRSSSHVYPSMHWAGCVYPSIDWVGGVRPGMYPSMHWGRHPTLWTEWLTDRCKNITFPQLRLRR